MNSETALTFKVSRLLYYTLGFLIEFRMFIHISNDSYSCKIAATSNSKKQLYLSPNFVEKGKGLMRQIQLSEFGTPEVLECLDTPSPTPQPHQVVVKVNYASLNPVDYKTRSGMGFVAEKVKKKLPWTPGYDIAGTISAKGLGVVGWELGQRVCGLVNFPLPGGSYSEQIAVNPEFLTTIPDSIDDATAAALPLAGLTAWQGLFETGNLCAGQNILILASAGGVGHIAMQLAKRVTGHVWGTASPENHDFLKKFGVYPVNYHDQKALEQLPEMDFIFDGVGGSTGLAALNYLREGGVMVTLPTVTADEIAMEAKSQGKNAVGYTVHPDTKQLQNLIQLIEEKQLEIEVSKQFPLEKVRDAHALLETGHVRGKLLLNLKPE